MHIRVSIKGVAVAATIVIVISACGSQAGHSTEAPAGNAATAQSKQAPATGPDSAPDSGSLTAPVTHAAAGSGPPPSARPKLVVSATDNSARPKLVAPATDNQVQLGAQFANGPPTFSFGSVVVGEPKTMRFSLADFSIQPLTILSVSIDNTAFTPTGDCDNQQLSPGDSCTVSVTFSPATDGSYQAGLTVTIDPADLTDTYGLDGSTASSPAPADTSTPTDTPTPADTSTPTDTPTPSGTSTPTDTPTPSGTSTPTDTPTPAGPST